MLRVWFLVVVLFSSSAAAERFIWPLAQTATGQTTLMAELSGQSLGGSTLYPAVAPALQGNQVADFLNRYYRYLVQGQIDEVTKLYFDGDGSLGEFRKTMADKPDRYKGFGQVQGVVGHYFLNWGGYKFVNVTYDTGQRRQHWREFLTCADGCNLSRGMNHIDESRGMFIRINGSLSRMSMEMPLGELVDKYDAEKKALSVPPVLLFADWAEAPRPDAYPVALYADIRYTQPVVVDVQPASAALAQQQRKRVPGIASYLDFVAAMRDVNIPSAEYDAKVMVGVNGVYQRFWADYNDGARIPAYRQLLSGGALGSSVVREDYTPLAYAIDVQSYDSLIVVASFDSEAARFVYFYPVSGDDIGSLRVLPLAKAGDDWRLSHSVQLDTTGVVMLSSVMAGEVHARTVDSLPAQEEAGVEG